MTRVVTVKTIPKIILLLTLCNSANIVAQDPGLPDTVQIGSTVIRLGESTPVPVRVVNDSDLHAAEFQWMVKSLDSGFARIDSVGFSGRLTDPSVLELRIVTLFSVDGVTPDSFLVAFQRLTNVLGPGDDTLFYLYMTGIRPGFFLIDTVRKSGGGGVGFVHSARGNLYRPVFEPPRLEVRNVEQAPKISIPPVPPVAANGPNDVEIEVFPESPSGRPVTTKLIAFSAFDDSLATPNTTPLYVDGNPGLFTWNPGSSDVGIWEATFEITDSLGGSGRNSATIQVVSNETYLVSFSISRNDSVVQATGILHGNLDGDPEPELFLPSIPYLSITGSYATYDLTASGNLVEKQRVSTGLASTGGVIGFINGDEFLDAIVSIWGDPIVLSGTGQNNLTIPEIPSSATYYAGRSAALADIDGDQHLDYILTRYLSDEVSIYLGSENGFTLDHMVAVGDRAISVNVADFDGDNRDDLAIGTSTGLEIYLNRGQAGFVFSARYDQSFGGADIDVTNRGSDFNNDNIFDLAVATPSVGGSRSELIVYTGNQDGTFDQALVRSVRGQAFANCVGDFNGDGESDIAYINGALRYLAIAFGDGEGRFLNELRYDIPELSPFHLDCMDIDIDGDLDIVVNAYRPGFAAALYLFLNNSDPMGIEQTYLEIRAHNNAHIELVTPTNNRLNRITSSIASGAYYRRTLDKDKNLDAIALISTIESGAYQLNLRPKENLAVHASYSLEYRLEGKLFRLSENDPMPLGGIQYTIYPDGNSPVSPLPGQFVTDPQPIFSWLGGEAHHFQLATDREFRVLLDSATVIGGMYVIPSILPKTDSAMYYWRVKAQGANEWQETFVFNSVALLVDVDDYDDTDEILPGDFRLGQNYPNPFNPSTVIEFELPHESFVKLTIHNVLGQLITTLVNRTMTAGSHTVQWIATDGAGNDPASGIYFYRIESGEFAATRKMVYLR